MLHESLAIFALCFSVDLEIEPVIGDNTLYIQLASFNNTIKLVVRYGPTFDIIKVRVYMHHHALGGVQYFFHIKNIGHAHSR